MKMSDDDLMIMSHQLIAEGTAYIDENISPNRAKAMRYYRGENPDGMPLLDGRSKMVDTQVRDTIEWILPDLTRIFAGDDEVVSIEPHGDEDIFDADIAQDWVNYVIMRQNRGFLNTYTWLKDALMAKLGFLKQYWKVETFRQREDYEGLTEDEYRFLVDAEDFEVADHSKTTMVEVVMPGGEVAMVPEDSELPGTPVETSDGLVTVDLYEVTGYRITEDARMVEEVIPPEEVIFLEDTKEIPWHCRMISHGCQKTIAELRDLFPDEDIPDDIQGWQISDDNYSLEELERYYETGELPYDQDDSQIKDPSQRKVWLYEVYMLCDRDGDGTAEWVQLFRVGDRAITVDEVDYPHIFTICPIPWTHRAVGFSLADLTVDLQELQTALNRSILDYVYSVNNPRTEIAMDLATEDTIDDYLDNRIGGYVRSKMPGAVSPLNTKQMEPWTFNLLEHWEQKRESRTGVSRLSGGLDPDALNKTATGVVQILNQAARRIEMIARIMAETGFRDRVRGILDLSAQYPDYVKGQVLRLTGKETRAMDPDKLKGRYDLIVNAGIGTGNKEQQMQQMLQLLEVHKGMMMAGLGPGTEKQIVTIKNIYNTAKDMIAGTGRRNISDYITDPDDKNAPRDEVKQPQPTKEQLDANQKKAELEQKEKESQREYQIKQQELQLKSRELDLKEREIGIKGYEAGRTAARSEAGQSSGEGRAGSQSKTAA